MTRDEELQAIETAIKAGKLRMLTPGQSSGWDDIPYRQRRSLKMEADKKSFKMRNSKKRKVYEL